MRVRGLWLLLPLIVVAAWITQLSSSAQSATGQLLALINQSRLAEGLPPYAASSTLATAAQRHSDDMAATGNIDHTGSDGSSPSQRITEAGYDVYQSGLAASESIFGGTTEGPNAAFSFWLTVPYDRDAIFSAKYREIGIAVAYDAQGQGYWTVCYGAQPNRLPVFVNDGTSLVYSPLVSLTLSPENVFPEGLGDAIGQPVSYRASTNDQFEGIAWEPWASKVPFRLDETPGQQTVYVELRDSAGRTSTNWAVVRLIGEGPTATASATEAATASATATLAHTATPTASATPSATATRTRTATATATPTRTPRPTSSATATGTATAMPSATATLTPTGTATRMPVPSSTPSPPPSSTWTSTSLPWPTDTMAVAAIEPSLLGPEGVPTEVKATKEAGLTSVSKWVPWALGLQILALGLGLYWALRRLPPQR